MKSISGIKADARQQLLGKYPTVVMAYAIIQFLISICLSPAESQLSLQNTISIMIYLAVYLIVVLLSAVVTCGQNLMYLHIARKQEYSLKELFWGFRFCADKAILIQLRYVGMLILYGIPFIISAMTAYYTSLSVASIFLMLITFLLWGLLTLRLSLFYSQVFFLIIDRSELSAKETIQLSSEMMKGHLLNYFLMLLSFIGMYLLTLITFGIASFWVYPYINAAKTNYYSELYQQMMRVDEQPSTFSVLV